MRRMRVPSPAGSTFVELLVAISIIAIALMVMLTQISISFREASISEQRAFAYRKAMEIMAEVQNGVERGDLPDSASLDKMADKAHNLTLTVLADDSGNPLEPDHPMSGNGMRLGNWEWSRLIEVETPDKQPQLRYVRVKVFRWRDSGSWELQATVGAMIAVTAAPFQSNEFYDVYVLAIAEAPSLWLPMPVARSLLESARLDLQTIDNGLKMRLHWITKLGYGRDPAYLPYLNTQLTADQAAPSVYWYPGRLAGVGEMALYSAELLGGRVRTDDGVQHDYDATTNPLPHAIADEFNQCMRLPEARALFEQRVAAGLESTDAPPLQILLEDMWRDPNRYRNAIFLNLHGPGLPMPPLRNYSDAAKDPVSHPGVRVVTHPERLWTMRDAFDWHVAENPVFRVYAYKTDPDVGPAVLDDPITVQIMGVDVSANVNGASAADFLQIRRLRGGIDSATGLATGTNRDYLPFDEAVTHAAAAQPYEMSYEVGYVAGPPSYTWIKLYNTPLVMPPVAGKGLDPSERLYGMEYIPSPIQSGVDAFKRDLAFTGAVGPRNTARWEIELPKRLLDPTFPNGFGSNDDQQVTVVTRIGSDLTTGTMWPVAHQPHNISKTYTWWLPSTAGIPFTERYQLLGDPRHNPYMDLVANGAAFAHGYNWHFDDLHESLYDASVKWPCLDDARLQDGFGAGVSADAPRMLQMLRTALQTCGGIFVNPCGPVAQSLLLGGEIALPGPTPGLLPTPVTVHGDFVGEGSSVAIDTVSPMVSGSAVLAGKQVVIGSGADPFWSQSWLGELCPDSSYADWLANGNLPTGSVPGTFHREPRSEAFLPRLPAGTSFAHPSASTMGLAGAVALLDTGTLASTFLPQEEQENPITHITAEAQAIASATGDELPPDMPCAWPFSLTGQFPGTLPYFGYTTSYPKTTSTLLEEYYNGNGTLTGAGAIACEAPSSLATAFFCLLGLTPTTPAQHAATAMEALMLGMRTFHRAGESSVPGRITQLPLVEIIEPESGMTFTDPSQVHLRWKTTFLRFDGNSYTSNYAPGFSEPEDDLEYSILYSRDEGETWFDALTSQPTQAEHRPTTGLLLDAGTGPEQYWLPTPAASYVGAEYLLRVECYHKTRRAHLSSHQVRIMLTR